MVLYRERLSVPVMWWVLAAGFALSLLLAVGFYVGPAWGLGVTAASLLVSAVWFWQLAVPVSVDAAGLHVGRAVLERAYIASCRPLDAEAAERRGGVEADARAHLVLKPYIATAVEIVLDDPDDPVPYWLVSTRRPARLAAALGAAAAEGVR